MKHTSGNGVRLTMRHPALRIDSRSSVTHARLVLDHLDVPGFAVLRERQNSFKPMNRRDH